MFVTDLVIYRLSSLFHKLAADVSPIMLNNTSSARHKWIVLSASISSHSSSVMVRGFFLFLSKPLCNPCWTNKSHIFNFQSSKLFLPLNFSISNFVLDIFFFLTFQPFKIFSAQTALQYYILQIIITGLNVLYIYII